MPLIKIILNGPSRPRRFADAGFEPGGQIVEMNAPAAVYGGVVVVPVLTFVDARVNETETCAIVFRGQFKGDCGGARLQSFPAIAEAMGRLIHEDLANFDRVRRPLEPDRSPRAQIDLGFHHKPAFQLCFLGQGPEDALWVALMNNSFLERMHLSKGKWRPSLVTRRKLV